MAGINNLVQWSAGPSSDQRFCMYSKIDKSLLLGFISSNPVVATDQNGNNVNVFLYNVHCLKRDKFDKILPSDTFQVIASGQSDLNKCKGILQSAVYDRLLKRRAQKQKQQEQEDADKD